MVMDAERQNRKKAYDLGSFRILIAEDYVFMADLMASMLREFGTGHILVANSGNEAKEMIMMFNADVGSRNQIDLVVTDWLMPDGDGEELIKWVRNSKKDSVRFLPVILCSAYTSEEIVVVARDSGANEALVKPVSAKKLASRILHIIDHPRPYIKSPDFFGPDRRRKVEKFSSAERRITNAEEIKEYHERI